MLREKVDNVIKEKIQPYLHMEGGDIDVLEIGEDGRVKVALKGTCAGCAMAMYTLKGLVEETLKREIPEIKEVVTEGM